MQLSDEIRLQRGGMAIAIRRVRMVGCGPNRLHCCRRIGPKSTTQRWSDDAPDPRLNGLVCVEGVAVMLTRRRALGGSVASGLAATWRVPEALALASQPATPLSFRMPANATDCHTHIHLDPAKYPWFDGRTYTPELATPKEMAALHSRLGIKRVVIVTPSVYGPDNAATLAGMKARGKNARGVAVIDNRTAPCELEAMQDAGVVGVRVNLATGGANNDPALGRERLAAAIKRVRPLKWHIQMYTNLATITALKDEIMKSPVPIVFDHFGGAKASLGVGQPGFSDLLDLVRTGKAYVKISGAYRASNATPNYDDATPLAKALIAANPERIVWGTDWPHPDSSPPKGQPVAQVTPLHQIDDGLLLNKLAEWAPSAALREQILVENPEELYGF
jgi:predicted TIM-barrel fold metal-dependent hydrolase